ncbi:DUF4191 domain-containing protein [Bifidobacterium sp. ESL0784]|uniref:DUF4191 domain-containing protein n=1 Tax=Bifidobacterium sp. ESL0784 TaxID=2983231 RepID=UPI0023F9D81C|nr:DUF4191 domain-containing protein [Bifidobacterium sp. ESL0784]MDF7640957.1 DUF4191 domain-containing protein [Bifidobacterium sp. ESL0784]
MAKEKKAKKDKKKGLKVINQIRQIYKYTYAEDKLLPWLLAGAFLLPVVVCVVIGLLLHWGWLTWILMLILVVMIGVLLFTMTLTNRADKVGYTKLEGKPGAAISVLGSINKAGYSFPETPVWIDPKTKDAIWRGTGYNGVYLLAEGNESRTRRPLERQKQAIKSVTAGSDIPIFSISIGTGEGQVRLKDLRKTVLKCKSYETIEHRFGFMDKIHPRHRFILTKDELDTLNGRLRTLQEKRGLGIPKGMDPTRPQHISRRAMRGR